MNTLLTVALIAIFAAACSGLLKRTNRETAILFSASAVILILFRLLPSIEELFDTIRAIAENSGFSEVISVLVKTLGIMVVSRFSLEICKDAGESAAAFGVEFAAKTATVLLVLPLIQRLLLLLEEALSL